MVDDRRVCSLVMDVWNKEEYAKFSNLGYSARLVLPERLVGVKFMVRCMIAFVFLLDLERKNAVMFHRAYDRNAERLV